MTMTRWWIGILLCGLAFEAGADEREFSFRLGIAHSAVDTEVGEGNPFLQQQIDFNDLGLRISLAAPIREHVDLEVGWTDFGSAELRFGDSHHGSAAWIAVAPRLESGPWSIAARIGAARTTADARFAGAFASVGEKKISTELFLGASAAYTFNDRHAAMLSLERVGDVATVVGLDYAYRWRTDDSAPSPGYGLELIAGVASTTGLIENFRFPADANTDVVVDDVESSQSTYAFGLRVPYRSWLSFEFVYFPTTSTRYLSGGLWDPPIMHPPDFGPPPPPGPLFAASTKQNAMLVAARFERLVARDLDAFVSVGALHTRQSVDLRNDATLSLYHRERESRTRAWLGVGLHYRLYRSLSLTVEHGTAGDGGRSRAMLGWSF